MDRESPRSTTDAIDLYIRTYYSLLRSSGDVWVRAFEEAHIFSKSSLHSQAQSGEIDVAAFSYSAARLPDCMPKVERLVLGQSIAQFEKAGLQVSQWETVTTRGRRRPLRWDGNDTLAVFIASASDIDDLIPILTAYQIEWNKMHAHLQKGELGELPLEERDREKLCTALGGDWENVVKKISRERSDRSVKLLNGSFTEYQRYANGWWEEIAPTYAKAANGNEPAPVYFVSSNSHSIVNLLGGYVRKNMDEIIRYANESNPEGLANDLQKAQDAGDDLTTQNILYYLLRNYLRESASSRIAPVQQHDQTYGITSVPSPGRIDVGVQQIRLRDLDPQLFDSRIQDLPDLELLRESDAVIINIDYPLGLAAYHHLCSVAQGVGDLLGMYVMGKAATLNGRVGDVMISEVVYDEHSRNTYLFGNQFSAGDVQPYMRGGTVFDNQKALTVRSAFLQNHDYMSLFYQEGYTVLEMESGPYLSAMYEVASPKRHPDDQIVRLGSLTRCEIGILHYASDTPYSRRQSLLSKSLSYFGIESTYACATAICRRILEREVQRLRNV